MSRFLSIRPLIIGASFIALIAVMVPFVTFAKEAPKKEVHMTVAVTQECYAIATNPGAQVLATFKKNDEVSGTAEMTSDDKPPASIPGESFQEGLVLIEYNGLSGASAKNGPFAMLILANSGPQHFHFTAPAKGYQLTACFATIGHDDDSDVTLPTIPADHAATVKLSVEH